MKVTASSPRASPAIPHTSGDLGGKFFELGEAAWGKSTTQSLFDGLMQLEKIENLPGVCWTNWRCSRFIGAVARIGRAAVKCFASAGDQPIWRSILYGCPVVPRRAVCIQGIRLGEAA